jgi:hypothetical protein
MDNEDVIRDMGKCQGKSEKGKGLCSNKHSAGDFE